MENSHNSSIAKGHLKTYADTRHLVSFNRRTKRPTAFLFPLIGVFLAILLVFSCNTDDSPLFEGDITIRSQADLDDLAKKGIRRINGNLSIGQHNEISLLADLTSLAGLASLEEVTGDFSILHATELESLKGLENLRSVGGNLSLFSNSKLESFSELSQLQEINGTLAIVGNLKISDLTPFDGLRGVRHLDVRSNSHLERLFDMSNIQTLGEVQIVANPELINIEELTNTRISALNIRSNTKLTSLKGLESTTSLRTLQLWQQDLITSMEGLENLGSITDSLILRSNTNLQNLDAMGLLEQGPFWLEVINNDKLESIDRFRLSSDTQPALASIMGNRELRGIEPLQGLETIKGLSVISSNKLEDLSDLVSLKEAEFIELGAIELLQDLQGLEQLRNVDYLYISSNPNLTHMDALSGLTQVSSMLSIRWNSSLTDLCGIRSVVSSGGFSSDYEVMENAFNPSVQDMSAGNCRN